MPKQKTWYEIHIVSKMTGERVLIAKVKSKGLANIVYATIKETYEKNREWKVE